MRYDGCIFENGTIPIIEPPIIEGRESKFATNSITSNRHKKPTQFHDFIIKSFRAHIAKKCKYQQTPTQFEFVL